MLQGYYNIDYPDIEGKRELGELSANYPQVYYSKKIAINAALSNYKRSEKGEISQFASESERRRKKVKIHKQ